MQPNTRTPRPHAHRPAQLAPPRRFLDRPQFDVVEQRSTMALFTARADGGSALLRLPTDVAFGRWPFRTKKLAVAARTAHAGAHGDTWRDVAYTE